VKDINPYVHVNVFKVAIKTNGEIENDKKINLFSFTFRNIVFDRCNNYMGDYPNYIFAKLQLAFYKRYEKVQNGEQVYV
jgi:hypothetical protein